MPKEVLIEIPISCANCGYPNQYGAKINAEITCKGTEEIVRKIWRCPICNNSKTIEIQMPKYEEKKSSRFFMQSPKKRSEELVPGRVSKMTDD